MLGIVALGALLLLTLSAVEASDAPTTRDARDARLAHPIDKDHPVEFKPDFPDRAAWEKRAKQLRQQVQVALGLWPMPPRPAITPVIHGKIDRDGYTIEKVYFASLPGYYVTGNLYRPKGKSGKLPAVLTPYGHWPEGRFMWGDDAKIQKDLASGAEKTPEGARSPLQANCAMLARMGCVVFHYDMVGYCDDHQLKHREGFTDSEAILRLQSTMGLQVWNGLRAVDFVASLPDVDANRIAVGGASGGGTQTIMLSILEPRIAVAFPAVMVSMNMQGGCVCENAPLLRLNTNNVELACLFAPKPQCAAAADDWTHDLETRGLPEMKKIYALYGAEDQVEAKHFPFPHNFNLHSRELMYDVMNRRLKLGYPSPVREAPYEPVPPAQLAVFDDAHPVPADATDAAGVRAWMTKTSDEQLKSADEPTLRTALGGMLADELPAIGDIEIVDQDGLLHPTGGGKWTGILARKGTGERVACHATFPPQWNGEIVIWADPSSAADPQKLLDQKMAVFTVEMIAPPPRPAPPKSLRPSPNPSYAGFYLCFNRSTLANRTHDLLTAIALVKSWDKTRSVHLAAFGDAGPSALLAKALANQQIARASIDLNGFDFDQCLADTGDWPNPMILPGGLKYGGLYGFLPLCTSGQTLLYHAKKTGQSNGVTLEEEQRKPDSAVGWLLR